MFKKLSLELGGKNATIVLDDVDLDSAIPEIARSGFLNQGQVCLCGSRILVSDKIWNDFLEKFIGHVSNMKVGDPFSDDSDLGALVSLSHRDKVESYIHLAEREGGEILCGGKRPSLESPFDEGSFLEPTIVSNLDYQSRTATEEIFGPVVTLHKFEKDEEVHSSSDHKKSHSHIRKDADRIQQFMTDDHSYVPDATCIVGSLNASSSIAFTMSMYFN